MLPNSPDGAKPEFHSASRKRLTRRDLVRFPDSTLFHKLARVVCEAECLPRRELYEAWAVARRVRRKLRGGRVLDVACGHGLVAWVMLLLDDSSPDAIALDIRLPPSAARIAEAMAQAWPRLAGRVALVQRSIADMPIEPGDVVVATHACGALSDVIIDKVLAANAQLALLTCCHDEETCDMGGLHGWLDVGTAVDVTRVAKLRARGYAVHTQLIPRDVTAQNRLVIAMPAAQAR
jgi:SAM-dependent methyltransferase